MELFNVKTCNYPQVITAFFRRVLDGFNCRRKDDSSLDNSQRARMTAVTLAFVCASLQKKLGKMQVRIISEWACEQLELCQANNSDAKQFRKAIRKAAKFFKGQCDVDICAMCSFIKQYMSASQRYSVLELCINVSLSDSVLSHEQAALLKAYSQLLKLDSERFRLMVEKYLPVDKSDDIDISLLLGIEQDMSEDQIRLVLNKEFRKWNARVTNQNPEVRKRADQMLKLITSHRLSHSA